MRARSVMVALALACTSIAAAQGPTDGNTPAERHKSGHSKLGEAFDEGPREKPSRIDGIGETHFPITTSKPEVQQWFDQGHTLLHSFWFFEAERAFRWAVKLDPDAPMPYWGLVRATGGTRAAAFMKEASRHRARARLHRDVGDSLSGRSRAAGFAQPFQPRDGEADHQVPG
jgi:hypothetical protein